MSTAAQITRSAEISYEQFCHAWIAEIKSHLSGENETPDAGELRYEVITRLLRDALQFDFGDDEIRWTDAAQCGFDAFAWDEDEDGSLILRLVRFLKVADLPADGRAVTRSIGEIMAALGAVDGHEDLRELRDFWAQPEQGARIALVFCRSTICRPAKPNRWPMPKRFFRPTRRAPPPSKRFRSIRFIIAIMWTPACVCHCACAATSKATAVL